MKVKRFVNGILNENAYVYYDDKNALIIDPGTINKDIEKFIENANLNVLAILVTHYHFDHVGGLSYFKDKYNCEVIDYKSNAHYSLNNSFDFKIIECFGHTLDSVVFYFEKDKIIFTGDFLFKETIGIYDKENEKIMFNSLKKVVNDFDRDFIVYPGHGDSTSVMHEIENNKFLRGL